MNSQPQYFKGEKCELTWAMVLELQEFVSPLLASSTGEAQSREARAGKGTRGFETRHVSEIPK